MEAIYRCRMTVLQKLRTRSIRMAIGEFLATLIFVLFSLGSTINWAIAEEQVHPASQLLISVCFGLSAAIIVRCFCNISGAHINPAVTLSMAFAGKLGVPRAFVLICAQCLGATTGSAILFALTPNAVRGNLGTTWLRPGLTVFQGFVVELLITFQMIFIVFATCDPNSYNLQSSAAMSIGISVTIGHLFAIPYTGASMNPARSLGPAIVTGEWNNHWMYWLGPILGGIIAASLYKHFLDPDLETPASEGERAPKMLLEEVEPVMTFNMEMKDLTEDPESCNIVVDIEMCDHNRLDAFDIIEEKLANDSVIQQQEEE
ncbi:hypothetical protein AAFF_G00144480 [Aldrovandia affinis]|uniref:Aquaporin-4 n=1 Tax=Aldrovandia affinis TaxID=143900 RepID=A0AAD7WWI5_9TELE|nr:hypothetical protein AAFF_G00144480 [Aldrovandia affinis]